MVYSYLYPRPAVTVDILVFTLSGHILLIKRKKEPFANYWAFPGGFLDIEETGEEAAQRELSEEANLQVPALFPLGFYDDPKRDPRGRTISLVFWSLISEIDAVKAEDDAAEAQWFPLSSLPTLAFDHKKIFEDSILHLKKKIKCDQDFFFSLFPDEKEKVYQWLKIIESLEEKEF